MQELLWVLGARMKEIQGRWEARWLQRAGFTRAEVTHLISAIFEDTDLRKQVLSAINNSR